MMVVGWFRGGIGGAVDGDDGGNGASNGGVCL